MRVFLLFISCLILAACGGGSSDSGGSNNTSNPLAAAASGNLNSVSGNSGSTVPISSGGSSTSTSSGSSSSGGSGGSGGGSGSGAFPSASLFAGTGSVWKPVSEGDGNLVILTPSTFGNSSITLLDFATGNTIESGRFVGRTNGDRATYRFSRPGGAYPSPLYVRLGGTVYLVNNSGQRLN